MRAMPPRRNLEIILTCSLGVLHQHEPDHKARWELCHGEQQTSTTHSHYWAITFPYISVRLLLLLYYLMEQ